MTKWYFADEHGREIEPSDDYKEDLFGFHNIASPKAVEEFADPIEGANSAGKILMKCVPYNVEGPHWRGTVQFRRAASKSL